MNNKATINCAFCKFENVFSTTIKNYNTNDKLNSYGFSSADMSTKEEMRRRLQPELSREPELPDSLRGMTSGPALGGHEFNATFLPEE